MSKAATYSVILMLTTAFAKVLGFARELALSNSYGASDISDAFVVAFSIPTHIIAGIGAAILICYIPIYTSIRKENPNQLKKFGDNVTTLIFLFSIIMLVVFWVFDRQIVKLFAWELEGEALAMTMVLSKIMMISGLFIGVYHIFQGFLQVHGSFFAVGMVSVPMNIAIMVSILVSTPHPSKG